MGRLLKPLVIIQLLLSIGALALGTMLFKQREVIKTRTQKLEDASGTFAAKIRFDDFHKDRLQVKVPTQFPAMDTELKKLATAGDNLYDDLMQTRQDLDNTKQDLAQTKSDLAHTQNELSDARNEITRLNETINQKDAEIAKANSKVDELTGEMDDLKSEIEGLNTQVAEAQEAVSECEANYASLERDYRKLSNSIDGPRTARGLMGSILLVNRDWNFVVLDIGGDEGIVPDVEMLVHRGDQLIGKVKVHTVEDYLCVAEILPGWEGRPLKTGDAVISPEG